MLTPFNDPEIAAKLEDLTEAELNALPYGVVRLNRFNIVQFFSEKEAAGSGMGMRGQVGKSYFDDIAPCFANSDYQGRIEQARRRGEVDIEMGWVGDFEDNDREILVRIVSAGDGGLWVLHSRDLDEAA